MTGATVRDVRRLWPVGRQHGTPLRAARFSPGHGSGPLPRVVEELTGSRVELTRDVTVGMPGDHVDLVAERGDFWFHTDAAFLAVPPRWMVIAVLEADGGGGLDLLPAELINPDALAAPVSYLTPRGVLVSPVLEPLSDGTGVNRLRYRQDRMLPAGDEAALDRAHRAVCAAAHLAVAVGELPPGECLLVDNWNVLHRRRHFTGRRVIRRLWFDEVR
jgi:Taurine catabolism dioxygenase TauD, TfdA family